MALLPILIAPDPRLKQKALPVVEVDDAIRTLMDDMLDTMYEAPGIGLAAPQVGVLKRVIVADVSREGEERRPLCLVNPEILWTSEDTKPYDEGCLSVPEQFETVVRPDRVRLRYLDRAGVPQELEADGVLAVVLQHEIDHLDGTLFVDHLSALKRGLVMRKLTKLKKNRARSNGRGAGAGAGAVA